MKNGALSQLLTISRKAYEWWIEELVNTGQTISRQISKYHEPKRRLIVTQNDIRLEEKQKHGHRVLSIATIEGYLPAKCPDQLKSYAEKRCRVLAVAPDTEILVSTVKWPPASRRSIVTAIKLNLEREQPLPVGKIYWTYSLSEQTSSASLTLIELATIQRKFADHILERLGQWGFRPASLQDATGRFRFDTTHPRYGDSLSGNTISFRRKLIVTALSLLILNTALLLGMASTDRSQAESLRQEYEQQAAPLGAQWHQLSDRLADAGIVAAWGNPIKTSAVLADLTDRLPPGSWLLELTLDEERGQIRGIAARDIDVSEAIGSSTILHDVRLRSRRIDGSGSELERFELLFQLASNTDQQR